MVVDGMVQVHGSCRETVPAECSLGPCRVCVLPPTSIDHVDTDGYWRASNKPPGTSPLLVFVNPNSGDHQVAYM